MKHLLFIKVFFLLLVSFDVLGEQTLDAEATTNLNIENNSSSILYSAGFTNTVEEVLHNATFSSQNDTLFFPVSLGEITPSSGTDSDKEATYLLFKGLIWCNQIQKKHLIKKRNKEIYLVSLRIE